MLTMIAAYLIPAVGGVLVGWLAKKLHVERRK